MAEAKTGKNQAGPAPADDAKSDVEAGLPAAVQEPAVAAVAEMTEAEQATARLVARLGPDAFGNVAGDDVIYWTIRSGTTILEPRVAKLLDYEPASGAWKGNTFRAIQDGTRVFYIARHSETPKLDHFTLLRKKG